MKPMAPMTPMKPMEPMKPMAPMSGGEAWWPDDLGKPSTSGGQNGMRYAFFPDKRRLLVQRDGATVTYETGDHAISGVQQQNGGDPVFSTGNGSVSLSDLQTVGS